MNLVFDQDRLIRYCSIACLSSVVGLLAIWVLPNTIALRHVFLGIGFIAAIPLILKTQFLSRKSIWELLPLLLLLALFIWVIVHLTFFSLNVDLEFKEFKTLWARTFLGLILAVGLSIGLQLNPKLCPYFFLSLFFISTINLVAYFYLSYVGGKFILPADFVTAFVFKKIEAAFFGVISVSIACANLIFLTKKKIHKNSFLCIFLWFLGIIIAIISTILANTKNGVVACMGLCLLLCLVISFKLFTNKAHSVFVGLASVVFIFILLFGGWKIHSKFATQGWDTLIQDVKLSSQVENHSFWKKNNKTSALVIIDGHLVAPNTYERVSWGAMGLKLIALQPMGYGSINRSFIGMLNNAGIEHWLDNQTHSGWIDFGLAFGIPGLVIIFATLLLIIYFGFKRGNQFGLMSAWLAVGFIPFGLIAEISYKHNFEILMFFVAFAATSVVGIRGPKSNKD